MADLSAQDSTGPSPDRWRPRPFQIFAGVGLAAALVLFPALGDRLLETFGARSLGAAIAVTGLVSMLMVRQSPSRTSRLWQLSGVGTFLLGATAAATGGAAPVLLLPSYVYLGLGTGFALSLQQADSLIERAARTLEPQAPDFIRGYCRRLTAVWSALFFLNSGIIAWLALAGYRDAWLLWTGAGTWLAIGGFSAFEFLFRKSWFRYYFYGGFFDQLWSRAFPPEVTERGRRSAAYIEKVRAQQPATPFPGLWSTRRPRAPVADLPTGRVSRTAHWSRVLRTGSAFALFGIASVGLAALAFVTSLWNRRDPDANSLRIQGYVQRMFHAFVSYMRILGILTVDLHKPELLRNTAGRIIVANHPTLLDVVLLVAHLPQADCVVKREAWSNPYLRGPVQAAGYIPNGEGRELVDACVRRLAQGRCILLFPEGTRSPRDGLGRFRRGVAHIALEAGCDILPVRIRCKPPTLMRGQKWYEVPDRAMTYTLEPGTAIPSLPYQRAVDAGEPRGRAARRMTAALKEFFQETRSA